MRVALQAGARPPRAGAAAAARHAQALHPARPGAEDPRRHLGRPAANPRADVADLSRAGMYLCAEPPLPAMSSRVQIADPARRRRAALRRRGGAPRQRRAGARVGDAARVRGAVRRHGARVPQVDRAAPGRPAPGGDAAPGRGRRRSHRRDAARVLPQAHLRRSLRAARRGAGRGVQRDPAPRPAVRPGPRRAREAPALAAAAPAGGGRARASQRGGRGARRPGAAGGARRRARQLPRRRPLPWPRASRSASSRRCGARTSPNARAT